ncbi:hypothetical protein TUM4433_33500 [Shewanella schlegeliana]|nr:hypothetical protein TUM4433_33500 [Shewanella schlegeliana]
MLTALQPELHCSNFQHFDAHLFRKQNLRLFFMQTRRNGKFALACEDEKGIIGALGARESLEGILTHKVSLTNW